MTKTILLVTAAIVFSAAMLFLVGQVATDARASLPDMATITLAKSDRLTLVDVNQDMAFDEGDSEWLLDCYDQFGPDAGTPDHGLLDRCLAS